MNDRDMGHRTWPLTKRLIRVWIWTTILLGSIAAGVGLAYGRESGEFKAYLLISGLTEFWLIVHLIRTWTTNVRYRWFWWRR